jgi:hypothetical protein
LANIWIVFGGLEEPGIVTPTLQLRIYVEGAANPIVTTYAGSLSSTALALIQGIKDAAIAACVAAGFTVGVLDKKTLFGTATEL